MDQEQLMIAAGVDYLMRLNVGATSINNVLADWPQLDDRASILL